MSELLPEEHARWLVNYKRRCKCCGSKCNSKNSLVIKILKTFQIYGMSGLGRISCFQKRI